MELSIIIVNWNTGQLLKNCVESIIKETTEAEYEIVIVDNDSKDNSCALIEENFPKGKFPQVNLIYAKDNLGFSRGNNLGIRNSKGKYLLMLNPDTIILNHAIDKAFKYIQTLGEKALLGAKLLNRDLSIQLTSCKFPTPVNIFRGSYPMSIEMHHKTHETSWVMGAFMMISREFYWQIGGLDESIFMYSEDLDLCYQVIKNGGKVIHYSEAEVIHLYNQSGKAKWNSNREKVVDDSTVKFLKKNYRGLNKYLTIASVRLKYYIKKLVKR